MFIFELFVFCEGQNESLSLSLFPGLNKAYPLYLVLIKVTCNSLMTLEL
jgi:hypothetical protein